MPTGEAARAEAALSVAADPEGAALLDDALAAVAVAVEVDGVGLPEILGAHLTGDRVELLLASSFDEVAPPFQASADGLRWTASAAGVAGFVAPADRPCSPAPTMELQRAVELTADPSRTGMALVVACDRTAARWVLDLDDELVYVGPPGLAVDPHGDSGRAVTAHCSRLRPGGSGGRELGPGDRGPYRRRAGG